MQHQQQQQVAVVSVDLECGQTIEKCPIAYTTYGQLNKSKDNGNSMLTVAVMLLCHAFSGSSNVQEW